MYSECAKARNRVGFTLLRAVYASDGASLYVFQICITERTSMFLLPFSKRIFPMSKYLNVERISN
jgi:hypothetical protein